MAEAKTAIKRGTVQAGNDIKPRYLQGSMYTTKAVRNAKRSSGGSKKLGKKKLTQLKSVVPIDRQGYTIGGWSNDNNTSV